LLGSLLSFLLKSISKNNLIPLIEKGKNTISIASHFYPNFI